ncbi:hypothetical protein ABID92_002835 [Frigoribacterium sp. PvP120]|uniref:hypothetical protein n=1 Tax=unclassified Frigoribacterium TaxID=2627005 RepID=UPI001AE38B2E|nr:hypothetical protein [Frigoribacterium sp. PvP121]MBP1240663.1 hypothetical protein [Frigoribacterium sp. PvP121]
MADPGDTAAAALPQGWVTLGERRWWTPWAGVQWFLLVLVAVNVMQIAWFLTRLLDVPFTGGLAAAVLVPIVVVVATVLVRAHRWPVAAVSLGSDSLRSGARTVSLAAVDAAQIGVVRRRGRPSIVTLRLSAGKAARAEAVLRDHRGQALDDDRRLVLVEALHRSSVAVPVSPDDPTGRFTRLNFPAHLDGDAAVAMALDPGAADALVEPRRLYQR